MNAANTTCQCASVVLPIIHQVYAKVFVPLSTKDIKIGIEVRLTHCSRLYCSQASSLQTKENQTLHYSMHCEFAPVCACACAYACVRAAVAEPLLGIY